MPLTPTPVLVSVEGDEPVPLDEMKDWLRVETDDDNTVITGLVTAAREWFETACDRSFRATVWELRLPGFGVFPVDIPYPPTAYPAVPDVTEFEIVYDDADGNEQTLATTVYDVVTGVTPARIQLADGQSWPTTDVGPEVVRVTFQTDDANVPAMVKTGIKMLVAYWYGYRGDEERLPPPPPAVEALVISARSHRF